MGVTRTQPDPWTHIEVETNGPFMRPSLDGTGAAPGPPAADHADLDPLLVERLVAELPALILEIVEEVVRTVPEGAKAVRWHFERGGGLGVDEQARRYLEQLTSPRMPEDERAALFRSLGRNAYRRGLNLDSLQAAFRVGTQIAWRRLAEIGRKVGASADQLCLLTERLFSSVDDGCACFLTGYNELAAIDADSLPARRARLLTALLDESSADAVAELARAAGWRPPRTVACVALDESWADAGHPPPALDPDVLADLDGPAPCLLVPDPDGPGRAGLLRRNLRELRFAIGPTVPLRQAPVSLRLARQALTLMRRGYLPEQNQIRCAEHLPALLVLSDQDVARQLIERHTTAFAELRPHQRETLEKTLFAWLATGGSFPDIAARLSVHPQTVRYRMHRLEELFGDRLQDPGWRYEMLLALHAEQLIGRVEPAEPDPAVR